MPKSIINYAVNIQYQLYSQLIKQIYKHSKVVTLKRSDCGEINLVYYSFQMRQLPNSKYQTLKKGAIIKVRTPMRAWLWIEFNKMTRDFEFN